MVINSQHFPSPDPSWEAWGWTGLGKTLAIALLSPGVGAQIAGIWGNHGQRRWVTSDLLIATSWSVTEPRQ